MADLGGSIITGIDGNPLAVLAAQVRPTRCEHFFRQGIASSASSAVPSPSGHPSPCHQAVRPMPAACAACHGSSDAYGSKRLHYHLFALPVQARIPLHDINTAGVPLYLDHGRLPDARIDRKARASLQPARPLSRSMLPSL